MISNPALWTKNFLFPGAPLTVFLLCVQSPITIVVLQRAAHLSRVVYSTCDRTKKYYKHARGGIIIIIIIIGRGKLPLLVWGVARGQAPRDFPAPRRKWLQAELKVHVHLLTLGEILLKVSFTFVILSFSMYRLFY